MVYNCTFENNWAAYYGVVRISTRSVLYMNDSYILYNEAYYKGSIGYILEASGTVFGNVEFIGN